MSKHILYINPTSVHGGAEEALISLMQSAQELGYRPVLVVPTEGWLTEQCHQLNIPCELLPSIPDPIASKTWRQQMRPWLLNGIAIAQLARKWQVVLIHSNTPRTSYHGGLGARFAGIPAVTHVHDIVGLPYSSGLKGRLLTALADYTLVPSHAVEQVVSQKVPWLRSHIQTLYYGWNIDKYANVQPANVRELFNLPPNAITIGTAAVLRPWKGQDVLIDAFKELYAEVPQARLLIVGDTQGGAEQDAYAAELRQKVANNGLQDVVVFTGWREDVWSLMRGFDVFVHVPTQPDPLPTSVIHASALGSVIVGADIGGIGEIVENGVSGKLVPPSDSLALSQALLELLNNSNKRRMLSEQAKLRFVKRFSRQQMVEGLAFAYKQIL